MERDINKKVDLVDIETEQFSLVIKGKPIHPTIEQLSPIDNETEAEIRITLPEDKLVSFKYYHPERGMISSENQVVHSYPVFYEQQEYDIYIESKGKVLDFYHQSSNIREAISHPPRNNKNLYGSINFGSDIGLSEFEIRAENMLLLTLIIEVFPSKIDYRDDYNKLLREVNEEVYNLAYDFLRNTYQNMKPEEARDVSEAEFYVILKTIYSDFMQAFKRIKDSPHHRLIKKRAVKPSAKVKKINRQSIKWLNKNSHFYDRKSKLPEKILAVEKKVSYNTFENKFVKWIFKQLIKRLNHFGKNYEFNAYNPESEVLKQINRMKREIEYNLKNSFLDEVGELYKIDSISLVLQMAPGYRELYKYYLILLKGLSLNGEIFKLSIKQLWQLYEYWTFLKLNRILADKYKLIKHNIIELDYSGITVTLSKRRDAEVKYLNPFSGEKFTLSYNSFSGDSPTTKQKPDNILTLEKENSDIKYKFILDAKYRINPAYKDSPYASKYEGIPGPEEDTINTMHRYRDAISAEIKKDNFARTMVGAYVLFPYYDQKKFREHKFYRSIEKVNVGAFPFLPGSIELVTEFLEDIIDESAISNFERNLLPYGTEEFRPQKDFVQNVVIGSLKKKSQLDFIMENNFYYMPYAKSVMGKDLKYVAIFQSKRKFNSQSGVRYYAVIEDIELVKRKEINFPTSRNPESDYILFHLGNWQELPKAIKTEGYGVSSSHIYSNDMLLKKADTLPELSIRTLREWRVWLELKRVKSQIKVKVKNKKLKELETIDGFSDGEISVKIRGDKLLCKSGDEEWKEDYSSFLKNPRGVLKSLMKDH
ncbi:MAG: DUF2357 domain-containing protein [bacterium]